MRNVLLVLLALGLAAGCGVPTEKYNTLESEAKACRSDLSSATNASNQCQMQLSGLSQSNQQLAQKTQTYDSLVKSLETEIRQGKIKISEAKDRLTVNLIDKILFDSGSTKIKTEGREALKKVAEVLRDVRDKRIQVEGHTDNVKVGPSLQGRYPTNWELSTARATSVVRFLAESGVPTEKLNAAGYGEFMPVASNDSDEGRSQNRRIEIALVPDLKAMWANYYERNPQQRPQENASATTPTQP
jgi:chemotaxis protein MotB